MNTYDTACEAIGGQREIDLEREALALQQKTIAEAHAKGYGLATHDLVAAAINLQSFSRGMVGRQVLPAYIAEAREALDRAEAALS